MPQNKPRRPGWGWQGFGVAPPPRPLPQPALLSPGSPKPTVLLFLAHQGLSSSGLHCRAQDTRGQPPFGRSRLKPNCVLTQHLPPPLRCVSRHSAGGICNRETSVLVCSFALCLFTEMQVPWKQAGVCPVQHCVPGAGRRAWHRAMFGKRVSGEQGVYGLKEESVGSCSDLFLSSRTKPRVGK